MLKSQENLIKIVGGLTPFEQNIIGLSLRHIIVQPTHSALTLGQKIIAKTALDFMETPILKQAFLRQFRKNIIANPEISDMDNATDAIASNDTDKILGQDNPFRPSHRG